jgi:hypothetical protein
VRTYDDGGGLWRLGHEMPGCALAARSLPVEKETATATASAFTGRLVFATASATREAWVDAGDPSLGLAIVAAAPSDTTRTVHFAFAVPPAAPYRTSLAGGFAERAPERLYAPTFWPAVGWASAGEVALLLRQSTGVRFGPDGQVEVLAVRNAGTEQCDVLGGTGSDPGTHRIAWRIARAAGPVEAERASLAWNRPITLHAATGGNGMLPAVGSLLSVEGEGVVSALKPADRGAGAILRVLLLPGPVTVRLGGPLAGRNLVRTDAVERDLDSLGAGAIVLDRERSGPIATVRLLP